MKRHNNWKKISGMLVVAIGISCLSANASPPHKHQASHEQTEADEKKPKHWTCSMHAEIKQTTPGKCSICGMDLVPTEQGENKDEHVH